MHLSPSTVEQNPFKRKIDAEVSSEVTVGKRARLDDLVENMKQSSNALELALKPSENGYKLDILVRGRS